MLQCLKEPPVTFAGFKPKSHNNSIRLCSKVFMFVPDRQNTDRIYNFPCSYSNMKIGFFFKPLWPSSTCK